LATEEHRFSGEAQVSARLPAVSSRDAIRAFQKAGFYELAGRGKGSHTVLCRDNPRTLLTVPGHSIVKRGTLRALIRQADMTVEEFVALL
jgi:predicted RNA binding protein YcfA (HicA-like mRNA interferase family)